MCVRQSLLLTLQLNPKDIPKFENWLSGSELDQARKAYEERLKPSPDGIPYAATILDAGDSSTLFVPALFEEPLHFADRDDFVFVTSLPGAMRALEGFAAAVGFDLKTELEPEVVDEVWDPIATCRNTARMMYAFFDEKPDACVEFG